MATKRKGNNTLFFQNVSIAGWASVVGKKEGEGPLARHYDVISDDAHFGQETWEKAESYMQTTAAQKAIEKANISTETVNYAFAGDLLDQCIGTHFGLRDLQIPLFGLYGACSTMAESLALAAITIEGGCADFCLSVASSHYCSAERQYRLPLEYGGQRTPTTQWTVTGAGAVVTDNSGKGPFIQHVTIGKIMDKGVKDITNMGAAMAPSNGIIGLYIKEVVCKGLGIYTMTWLL